MSELEQERNLIFVSYTTADRERVLPYYVALKSSAYELWMDIHDIRGGQKWEFEISKAIDRANIILSFISKNSIDRRGYIQKEFRMAMEKYKEKRDSDIFIIPVLLDDIELPDTIKALHVLYDKDENCIENIRNSISTQLSEFGKAISKVQESHDLSWSYFRYRTLGRGYPDMMQATSLFGYIRLSIPTSRKLVIL